MKQFVIATYCDPVNAKTKWHGEDVLERSDYFTPVKWVRFNDYFTTKEEALDAMKTLANIVMLEHDDLAWEDDETMAIWENELDLEGERYDHSWYEGPGVYCVNGHFLVWKEGDERLEDDVLTYKIEEIDV